MLWEMIETIGEMWASIREEVGIVIQLLGICVLIILFVGTVINLSF